MKKLQGREIEAVPYTGLVETLSMINIMCETAAYSKEDLSKQELISFFAQISEKVAEAFIFSGVEKEEINYVTEYLLKGLQIERTTPH